MNVFEKIEAQQKGKEETAPWMVGEQLKDILRGQPELQELVDKDIDNKGMGLEDCEKKLKAYADKHHKGSSFCVIPTVAEKIIREFYGLPGQTAAPALRLVEQAPETVEVRAAPTDTMDMLDLSSFL